MYEVLSRVYDPWQKSYGKDYSTIILPQLLATIKFLGIPKSTMLDLACGTGALAVLMA
jgi:ubiquinone/menaquinone biosynthesis C-methylase UbiE